MKKYSHLLLAGLFSAFVISCDDDSVPVVSDTEDPTAQLTSPTQAELDAGFAAGQSFTIAGTVSDNRDLETVTLTIMAPGGTTPWYTKTWSENDNVFVDETLTLNEPIMIPADAAPGTHVMTLMAMDDADNEFTQSWNIMVLDPNARFNVSVPAGTPQDAQIFVVGTFVDGGWDADDTNEAFMLTRNDDGTFSGNFVLPEGEAQQFKFRIKSDDPANAWKFEERTVECAQTADRTATGTADMQTLTFDVANWQNITCTP